MFKTSILPFGSFNLKLCLQNSQLELQTWTFICASSYWWWSQLWWLCSSWDQRWPAVWRSKEWRRWAEPCYRTPQWDSRPPPKNDNTFRPISSPPNQCKVLYLIYSPGWSHLPRTQSWGCSRWCRRAGASRSTGPSLFGCYLPADRSWGASTSEQPLKQIWTVWFNCVSFQSQKIQFFTDRIITTIRTSISPYMQALGTVYKLNGSWPVVNSVVVAALLARSLTAYTFTV